MYICLFLFFCVSLIIPLEGTTMEIRYLIQAWSGDFLTRAVNARKNGSAHATTRAKIARVFFTRTCSHTFSHYLSFINKQLLSPSVMVG